MDVRWLGCTTHAAIGSCPFPTNPPATGRPSTSFLQSRALSVPMAATYRGREASFLAPPGWHTPTISRTTALWLHISVGIDGTMRLLGISVDVVKLQNLLAHFPVGSVLRCAVICIDAANDKLDLSARGIETVQPLLTVGPSNSGTVVPRRVTKVPDRHVLAQLSDTVVGSLVLIDVADDSAGANIPSFWCISEMWRSRTGECPNRLGRRERLTRICRSGIQKSTTSGTSRVGNCGGACEGGVWLVGHILNAGPLWVDVGGCGDGGGG